MYPQSVYYGVVSPYGIPFPMMGGNVFTDSVKSFGKKSVAMGKKVYGNIANSDTVGQIREKAEDLGSFAVEKGKDAIEEAGTQLSSSASNKLAGLLKEGKSKSKGLSKKAKSMLKKMMKKGMKKGLAKKAKMISQKSVSQLSKLLSGKGLRVMA